MNGGEEEEKGRILTRTIWREGANRRVTMGSIIVAAGGMAFASMRNFGPSTAVRASAACALISCPFFALREVVAGGLAVDGPVASAIVGGVAGYVGSLAFPSVSWKAVGHSAMVVGVGAGVTDFVISSIDFRFKAFLLARQDAVAREKAAAVASSSIGGGDNHGTSTTGSRANSNSTSNSVASMGNGKTPRLKTGGGGMNVITSLHSSHDNADNGMRENNAMSATAAAARSQRVQRAQQQQQRRDQNNGDLPIWMPSNTRADKDEYENLLQSQKATAAALQQEQDRIARLLATIERLKADSDGSSDSVDCPVNANTGAPAAVSRLTGSNAGAANHPRRPPPAAKVQ